MKRMMSNWSAALATVATFTTALALAPAGSENYDLSWHTVDGGGGMSSAAALAVEGTIGQHDAGIMNGGAFELVGGFWAGAGSPTVPTCPGDIAPGEGDGLVNVIDLLAIINNWGACTSPCPPSCSTDINSDCSTNVIDLLAVINQWGSCP